MGAIISFDSILVRLKAAEYGFLRPIFDTFRFHTGSIKRVSDVVSASVSLMFRFHTGSIKRMQRYFIPIPSTLFRFHTGSIKS